MNGLAPEFDLISFERINVGMRENEDFQRQFGLRGHPSWVLLDESGAVVEKKVGAVSAETLRSVLEQIE